MPCRLGMVGRLLVVGVKNVWGMRHPYCQMLPRRQQDSIVLTLCRCWLTHYRGYTNMWISMLSYGRMWISCRRSDLSAHESEPVWISTLWRRRCKCCCCHSYCSYCGNGYQNHCECFSLYHLNAHNHGSK